MHVELVSPEREVWSGDAEAVYARTTDGELGILPGHTPLIGTLVEYPVRIQRDDGDELVAAVLGGFLSVLESGVSILGEVIEMADEIDVEAARRALDEHRGAEDEQGQAAFRRAEARLRAAGQSL
jgi:F-type H+-transporting ATPase subunit epsilon